MNRSPGSSNRLTLLFIAGLPLTMILLATWLWSYVVSGRIDLVDVLGTANRGELLSPPLPLQDVELFDAGGDKVELFPAENGFWRILIPGRENCDEACVSDLYYTRQIRTAMGKYSNRIERIYLVHDLQAATGLPGDLLAEHPGLKVLYTPGAELWSGLAAAERQAAYFLVDPSGWVMMFYRSGTDGKAVMADLNFLLKNSSG
jgi:cytochrome oxidase Cu insertion factor (SCO1/SenC/PrrC family)